jgi:hypothetical protein
MTKIEIIVPDGKSAEWKNGVLTLVDATPKDDRPITERVKSYEDACEILGKDPLKKFKEGDLAKDEVAYIKLKTICEALNEGWTPKLVSGEIRWYPWYGLYTKKEIEAKSKSDRKKQRGLLVGGVASYGAHCGFAYLLSGNAPSDTIARIGSRLCLKSEDLSDYCAKQFIEIWFEYLFPDFEIVDPDWSNE